MITIVKENGFYVPQKPNGANEYILPSDFEKILDDLIYYCEIYTDEEVENVNELRRKNLENYIKSISSTDKPTKSNKCGFVYVLKCADKYKIGYSKDVDQRIRQLDTRPFKLELVFKAYSNNAYKLEQELHNRLDAYRETGEWYSNINEEMIKNMMIEIARYLKCDIQF